uniref:FAS1 domain-containing protein n=1 Tax=Loa loa TaxID=7209 RepID=A0A1I7VIZ7_LOALO
LFILSNDMISVMNGINNPASFGFSGSFMDKPFYQKFATANVTTPASVAVVVTTAAATAASSSGSSATNENDRTSTHLHLQPGITFKAFEIIDKVF